MAALGIKVRRYKVGAAWIGEKAGRLKFNGHLFTGSSLRTWKNWKSCGSAWKRRPRAGAPCGPWPIQMCGSTPRLDELISRVRRQAGLLEDLRGRRRRPGNQGRLG
jgi:hypothetical protein